MHAKYSLPQKSASKNHIGPMVCPLLYFGDELAVKSKYIASCRLLSYLRMSIITAIMPKTKYGYINFLVRCE